MEESNCCVKGCLRKFLFWYLYVVVFLPLTSPLLIIMTIIFLFHEKPTNGVFVMAWDPLALRFILSQMGVKPDPYTEAILEEGLPGLEFLRELPNVNRAMFYYSCWWPFKVLMNLTGHIPDLMKIDPSPDCIGSIYTIRMNFIDEQLKKAAEMGDVEQLVVIGAGWDLRSVAFHKEYPGVSCIEVDLPIMQTIKAEACKKHAVPIHPVTLIPHAFYTNKDVLDICTKIDMKKKTFVIVEGVSLFLNTGVVESLVLLMKEFPYGSKMAMDLWIERPCSWNVWSWKIGKCFTSSALRLIGEPVKFKLDLINDDVLETIDAFCHVVTNSNVEVALAQPTYIGAVALFQRS